MKLLHISDTGCIRYDQIESIHIEQDCRDYKNVFGSTAKIYKITTTLFVKTLSGEKIVVEERCKKITVSDCDELQKTQEVELKLMKQRYDEIVKNLEELN